MCRLGLGAGWGVLVWFFESLRGEIVRGVAWLTWEGRCVRR